MLELHQKLTWMPAQKSLQQCQETKVKIHPIVFGLDLAKHAWDPRLNMINTEVHMGAELANHCSGVLLFALIRHLLPSKKPTFTATSFSIP